MQNDLASAQADMRHAYRGGAPGMLASAAVWLASGLVAATGTPRTAMWVLLAGGMLIHPLGVLLARLLGRPGRHAKDNPLGLLAGASTVWLVFSLPLAWAAGQLQPGWFFPAMLLVIGGRYLVFDTLYGLRLYWACGLALAAAGVALGMTAAAPALAALSGAALEAGFALAVLTADRRLAAPGALPSAG